MFKKVASLTRLKLLSSLLSSKSLTLIRTICQTIDPFPISTIYKKILEKRFLSRLQPHILTYPISTLTNQLTIAIILPKQLSSAHSITSTSTFLSPLHPPLTSVLVFVLPLLSCGTQYPSQSVHFPPSNP